jgi:DNA-binding SARP family transcriptional activator
VPTDPPSAPHLLTLGRLALITGDDRPGGISAASTKLLAILAYLSCAPGRRATRDQLVDLFFADSPPDKARNALRQAIHKLREALGGDIVASGPTHDVTLCTDLTTDREQFDEALDAGDLAAALGLYHGPFAPGLVSVGSAGFEHWADQERDRLHLLFTNAAEELGREALRRGEARTALHLAQRMLAHDRLDERAWRLRLEAESLGASSVHLAASIEELRHAFGADGREPAPRTMQLIAMLLQPQPGPADGRSTDTLTAELVGRRRELGELHAAWREAQARRGGHLHITAAAGMGKTRLLDDFALRLRTESGRAALVHVTPHERTLPYAALSALAEAASQLPGAAAVAPAVIPILVALQPRISERFSVPPSAVRTDSAESERLRTEAVTDLLLAVAGDGPVALLLDDLHWWDPVSRRVLERVIEHSRNTGLLIVTASRPGDGELVDNSGTPPTRLGPLATRDIVELIQSLGDCEQQAAEMLAAGLARATDGVPLLVLEALRLGIDRQQLALCAGRWDIIAPTEFIASLHPGSLLAERIRALTPAQREVLLLLATFESPISREQLDAAGLSGVENDLLYLEQHGLLAVRGGRWIVAHDAIAEAAVAMADQGARHVAHIRAGQARLAESHDDMALRDAARHFRTAGDVGDAATVAERWIRRRREEGSRRRASELAADLFGADPQDSWVVTIVRALPRSARRRPMHPAWRPVAGAAAIMLLAAAWWGMSRRSPDERLGVFVVAGADIGTEYQATWNRMGWDEAAPDSPLPLHLLRHSPWLGVVDSLNDAPVADPSGQRWAYSLMTVKNGATELVVQNSDGSRKLVAPAAGDDVTPSWSPDGRQIAFATTRYADGGGTFDIAIVDVASGAVRRLTATRDIETSPQWSPDGSRIAFVRQPERLGPAALCWVTVDGAEETCTPFAPDVLQEVVGWHGNDSVIIQSGTTGDVTSLIMTDLRANRGRVLLHGRLGFSSLSPDGAWLASHGRPDGALEQGRSIIVTSMEKPSTVRTAALASGDVTIFWHGRTRREYIDHLIVAPNADTIPGRTAFRMSVSGVTPDGDTIAIPGAVIRWRSSDTSVAVISRDGLVTPIGDGSVTFTVTAGGWRTTSVEREVVGESAAIAFHEEWTANWLDRWGRFGEPESRVITTSDGARALFPNGDDTYTSGVYTRQQFDARRGLAVEAEIRTPITRSWSQKIEFSMGHVSSFGREGVPIGPPAIPSCSLTYPAFEGGSGIGVIGVTDANVPVDTSLASGRRYRLRIQLFPDGTCGYAIDGKSIHRSTRPHSINLPTDIIITSQTYHADIFVGPLTVWQGIPPGVNWTQPEMAADSG